MEFYKKNFQTKQKTILWLFKQNCGLAFRHIAIGFLAPINPLALGLLTTCIMVANVRIYVIAIATCVQMQFYQWLCIATYIHFSIYIRDKFKTVPRRAKAIWLFTIAIYCSPVIIKPMASHCIYIYKVACTIDIIRRSPSHYTYMLSGCKLRIWANGLYI